VKKFIFAAFLIPVASCVSAQSSDIAKYDPNMAIQNAVVTNGVKWIDGRYLPIEGRAFADVEHFYDRLPKNVTTNVNAGVRAMKHDTAGMQARFSTTSKRLQIKWVPYDGKLAMDHMPATGVSGVDVYVRKPGKKWRYAKTGRISKATGSAVTVDLWGDSNEVIINFPLYNGLKSLKVGIDGKATITPLPPRASGIDKPVVFYGTSITHGGCASRPGLAFVSILGRNLDVPVVNLGFSGSGRMEYEMSEHVSAIDASCYVLDCLWNMRMKDKQGLPEYEPFIRNLRAKRPGVPIIMAGYCDVFCRPVNPKENFTRKLYDKLIAEGWKDLYFLPGAGMLGDDREGTVDGVHPNDIGMVRMAEAYGKSVKEALKLK
jgi:lysophospholipase L1-like esterase